MLLAFTIRCRGNHAVAAHLDEESGVIETVYEPGIQMDDKPTINRGDGFAVSEVPGLERVSDDQERVRPILKAYLEKTLRDEIKTGKRSRPSGGK